MIEERVLSVPTLWDRAAALLRHRVLDRLAVVLGLGLVLGLSGAPAVAQGSCTGSFQQVNTGGFGERHNLYAWSMQVFNGHLYVGTLNNVDGPQIWRWGGTGTTWTKVHSRDFATTGNTGFRSMTVYKGQLYAATVNETQGAELWRSADGTSWQMVATGGLGTPNNTSFRGLTEFGQWLYMGTQNQSGTGAQLWRSNDGVTWRQIIGAGFGDVTNESAHALAVFGGQLYVGTTNTVRMQIFRSRDGLNFEQVVGPNAAVAAGFGLAGNTNTQHLYAYNKRLYVGTGNQHYGFSVFRTTDGSTYQKVASGGAGDPNNMFAWRFIGYQGHLWLGTGNFNVTGGEGSSLLRSADGLQNWETLVGRNGTYYSYGFDKVLNWGIRTLAEYNQKLYVGTAQCWKSYCDPVTTGAEIWEWSGETCPAATAP